MAEGIDIKVGVRNAAFHKGLDEMRAGTKKFKADLSNMLAGAIGFGAVTAAMQRTLAYADTIADLAQIHSVGTTELQQFGQAAEQNASSFGAMASAFQKMEVARSKALSGNQELIAHFQALGVSIEDLRNLSASEIMLKIGGSAMHTADMVAVLGKSSAELKTTLGGLADGSIELGAAMEEGTIQSLAKFSDLLKQVSNQITVWIGEAVVGFSTFWEKFTVMAVTGFRQTLAVVTGGSKAIWEAMKGNFGGARAEVARLMGELMRLNDVMKLQMSEYEPDDRKPKPKPRTEEEDPDDIAARKKKADDEAKKALEERQRKEKEIADARKREADEQRDFDISKMDSAGKVKALQEDKSKLLDDAAKLEDSDPAEAAKKRTEAIKLQREINAEMEKMAEASDRKAKEREEKKLEEEKAAEDKRRDAAAGIITDSLQSVGGGGSASSLTGDPAMRERQQQTQAQREIVQILRQFAAGAQPNNFPQPWR
jgi:hypothetical protein